MKPINLTLRCGMACGMDAELVLYYQRSVYEDGTGFTTLTYKGPHSPATIEIQESPAEITDMIKEAQRERSY